MEVLNTDLTFPIKFDRSTAESVLSLALRGLSLTTNKKILKQDSKLNLSAKSINEQQKLITNNLPIYTLNEVAQHQSHTSCWIVLYDRVYDVTSFLDLHPGGMDILYENAGVDATLAFQGFHSKMAMNMLKDYLIGELPENERLYRKSKNLSISLSDMPE